MRSRAQHQSDVTMIVGGSNETCSVTQASQLPPDKSYAARNLSDMPQTPTILHGRLGGSWENPTFLSCHVPTGHICPNVVARVTLVRRNGLTFRFPTVPLQATAPRWRDLACRASLHPTWRHLNADYICVIWYAEGVRERTGPMCMPSWGQLTLDEGWSIRGSSQYQSDVVGEA